MTGAPQQSQVIAVTGVAHGAGATTIAIALAEAFAGTGARVLLVDAAVRSPRLHARLGVPGHGLAESLTSDDPLRLARPIGQMPGVDVIACGPSAGLADLVADRMDVRWFTAVRSAYDQVIIDTSPIAGSAEGRHIAHQADLVVVTARLMRSRAGEMDRALRIADRWCGTPGARRDRGARIARPRPASASPPTPPARPARWPGMSPPATGFIAPVPLGPDPMPGPIGGSLGRPVGVGAPTVVRHASLGERLSQGLLLLVLFGISAEGAIALLPSGNGFNRLIGFLLFAAFGLALVEGRVMRRAAGLGRHLAVITVWIQATLMWGVTAPSLRNLVLFLQLPLLLVIGYQLLDTKERLLRGMVAFGTGGVVAASVVISRWTTKQSYGGTSRYSIGDVDANLSGIVLVASAVALWFGLRSSPLTRPLRPPLIALVLFALVLTGSRGSMITLGLCAGYSLLDAVLRRRIVAMVIGFTMVVGAIAFVRSEFVPEESRDRLDTVLDSNASTAVIRQQGWRIGIKTFYRRPLSGSGLDTFPKLHRAPNGTPLAAHSDYIRVLVEFGLPGFVLIYSLFARVLVRSSLLESRLCLLIVLFGGLTLDMVTSKTYWALAMFAVSVTALQRTGAWVDQRRRRRLQ